MYRRLTCRSRDMRNMAILWRVDDGIFIKLHMDEGKTEREYLTEEKKVLRYQTTRLGCDVYRSSESHTFKDENDAPDYVKNYFEYMNQVAGLIGIVGNKVDEAFQDFWKILTTSANIEKLDSVPSCPEMPDKS